MEGENEDEMGLAKSQFLIEERQKVVEEYKKEVIRPHIEVWQQNVMSM